MTKGHKMEKIQLFVEDGWWHADFIGDAQTLDLFGTTVLPTPFEQSIPAHLVLGTIREINPGKLVELR